ncbi:baeRF12 domain-containing protein [Radicibacter daui]|uniref:baeRF12 domain-containing protein n=1 Tax=Radicibacter daui TaxID=3064829 RepID=UPI0040468991
MDDFSVPAAIPWQSWVVVCDGAQARIFRNDGEANHLNLHQMAVLPQPLLEASDSLDQPRDADAEARFLDNLAHRIEGAVRVGAMERFVLVAPPQALERLRQCLGPLGRDALSGETSCDMTLFNTATIERRLGRRVH